MLTIILYTSLLIILVSLTYLGSKVKGTTYPEFDIFNKTKLTPFHWAALLLISVIVGFRYEVGTDWIGYKEWFDYYKVVPMDSLNQLNFELGFLYLNYFFANLGTDYTAMFFSVAILSWFFLIKGVSAKILPLFLFFIFVDEYFFWSMNGIRQFVCISIFIYSIRFIIERNFKKYLLFTVFSALFHSSSVILIPLYFVPWEKVYKPNKWFIVFFISLFLANTPMIMNSIESTLMNIGNSIPLLSIYLKYFENGRFEASANQVGLGYFFKVLIAFVIFYYSVSVTEKYPNTKIFFVLFFLGSIIYNLFYMFPLIGRVNLYFIFMRTITLSLVIFYLWTENRHKPLVIGISLLYFILFLVTIQNSSNDCCPYQFRLG